MMNDTGKQAIDYINSVTWRESKLGLRRMRELAQRMGNPQNRLRFIHVAGTNGKGSVCAMLASVLCQAGYRVGLFTSPYISCFNERMQVNGEAIPNGELAACTERMKSFAEAMEDHPTEFEMGFAVALEWFSRRACDVVVLETGDAVPADVRLAEAANLKIEEAALTGESVPVEKNTEPIAGEVPLGDRVNMAFGSTSVSYGRGRGIVTATGMDSEVGRIACMIQSVPATKTPLQEKLDRLGRTLAIAALVICVVIFGVGVLYGKGLLEMFMTAVSLAVAAIPEGLPAVATVVLAVGVQRLVKKNAIVRRLPSVETLGSTQVICSDKTGTLTRNRMTVVKVWMVGGEARDVEGLTADALSRWQSIRYWPTMRGSRAQGRSVRLWVILRKLRCSIWG